MRKKLVRNWIVAAITAGFTIIAVASVAAASADMGAMMKPPATNAAVVAVMPGFENYRYKTFFRELNVAEGLVIRQSRVENGKIIIPKYGLYYTTRTEPAELLKGEKTMILGKMYTIVDTDARFDVLSNVFAKKKQPILFGDKSKALELTDLGLEDNGYEGVKATFKILKPSGNYYGTDFPVSADPKMGDITNGLLKNGTGKKTGSYLPGEGSNWTKEFWDRSANTSGQTYIVVESTTAEGVKVKEFGTPAVPAIYVTDKDPVQLLLGTGEAYKLGDYTVKVLAVGKDTATIELQSKDGTVTKKVLGPLNHETEKYLPTDHLSRGKMIMRSAANEVQVSLDVFREPFRGGKVALLGYYDVFKLDTGDKLPGDPRFTVRPDT
jgi:hypothetical protein